jgi:hypothetical protein
MKYLSVLLIAFFAAQLTFAQKSKAFETKPNNSTLIKIGTPNVSLSAKEQMKAEVTKAHSYPGTAVIGYYSPKCPKCEEGVAINRTWSKQAVKIYTCEMHMQTACNKDGNCPFCYKS